MHANAFTKIDNHVIGLVQSGQISLAELGYFVIRRSFSDGSGKATKIRRETIARRAGLSPSKVSNYDRRLQDAGAISIQRTGRASVCTFHTLNSQAQSQSAEKYGKVRRDFRQEPLPNYEVSKSVEKCRGLFGKSVTSEVTESSGQMLPNRHISKSLEVRSQSQLSDRISDPLKSYPFKIDSINTNHPDRSDLLNGGGESATLGDQESRVSILRSFGFPMHSAKALIKQYPDRTSPELLNAIGVKVKLDPRVKNPIGFVKWAVQSGEWIPPTTTKASPSSIQDNVKLRQCQSCHSETWTDSTALHYQCPACRDHQRRTPKGLESTFSAKAMFHNLLAQRTHRSVVV